MLVVFAGRDAKASDLAFPHVTVFGTAVTEIVPDTLKWHITVKSQKANLVDVAKHHADVVANVLERLKQHGIASDETQTAEMQFGVNWEYRNSSRVRNGYLATTDISFKMTDLAKYRDIWMGLAAISEVDINSVSFDSSRRIEVQNETRRKALIAARDKARDMAQTLNSEIGETIAAEEIQDLSDYWQSNGVSNSVSFDDSSDSSGSNALSPGRIPVKIRVKVTFRLVANSE